jgi:YaiO family outer membrane protein
MFYSFYGSLLKKNHLIKGTHTDYLESQKGYFSFLLCITFFLFFAGNTHAYVKTDSLLTLKTAVKYAAIGEYASAKKICYQILKDAPGNSQAKTLLGRIYSWTNQYDSARFFLNQVLEKDPHDEPALNAMANVEIWSGNASKALVYCDSGLKWFPGSESFYLKKAKALRKQNRLYVARQTTNELIKLNPKNKDALKFLETLKDEIRVNRVGVFYNYDIFSITYTPWNFVSMYLARKTKYGSILGSVNYANRFNRSGLQYEMDLYPKITKKMYAYLNAGFSPDSIFPRLRLGSSLYHKLPFKSEIELGIRYLDYPDINQSIVIYTGSLSKYVNRFWFSVRPFITPKPNGTSYIYYVSFRYFYVKSMNSYVTATFSSGRNPYEYYTLDSLSNTVVNTYSLQSKRIKLDLYTVIAKYNVLKVSVAYDQREYRLNTFRDHGIFGLGYERLF